MVLPEHWTRAALSPPPSPPAALEITSRPAKNPSPGRLRQLLRTVLVATDERAKGKSALLPISVETSDSTPSVRMPVKPWMPPTPNTRRRFNWIPALRILLLLPVVLMTFITCTNTANPSKLETFAADVFDYNLVSSMQILYIDDQVITFATWFLSVLLSHIPKQPTERVWSWDAILDTHIRSALLTQSYLFTTALGYPSAETLLTFFALYGTSHSAYAHNHVVCLPCRHPLSPLTVSSIDDRSLAVVLWMITVAIGLFLRGAVKAIHTHTGKGYSDFVLRQVRNWQQYSQQHYCTNFLQSRPIIAPPSYFHL